MTQARCPDTLLWALWAAKETAYKVASKIHPGVSSAPRLYRVKYDDGEAAATGTGDYVHGLVSTPCGDVSIGLLFSREYVHCIGVAGPQADIRKIVWGINPLPGDGNTAAADESLFVRERAGKRLAACLATGPADIEIRRRKVSSGLAEPLVYCRGRRTAIDISLSHDGRFAAYAFLSDREGASPVSEVARRPGPGAADLT